MYSKYITCKNDYNTLKLKSLCFNFNHNTKSIKSIKKILKSGKIKSGSSLNKSERRLSGGIPQKYIYSNIFFDTHSIHPYSLIISGNIILTNDILFNKGWLANKTPNSISINKTDTLESKIRAIKKIKSNVSIKNDSVENFMNHEILFETDIDVHKHVIGISCYEKDKPIIQKYLNNCNYKNITLYTIKNEI